MKYNYLKTIQQIIPPPFWNAVNDVLTHCWLEECIDHFLQLQCIINHCKWSNLKYRNYLHNAIDGFISSINWTCSNWTFYMFRSIRIDQFDSRCRKTKSSTCDLTRSLKSQVQTPPLKKSLKLGKHGHSNLPEDHQGTR